MKLACLSAREAARQQDKKGAMAGFGTKALILAMLGLAGASTAQATPYLGTAADFTVLGLAGGSMLINSATSITGNVGYGANVQSHTNQKIDSFTGAAYVHSTADFAYTPATYMPSGGIQTSASADAKLEQANADAISASALLAGLAPTHASLGNVGDNQNVVINSVGLLNVIPIASLKHKSDTFTIHGGAADVFVFNVAGNWDYDQSQIVLDGVSVDHVFFNFPNASTILIGKESTVFGGTILAPTGTVDYHNPASFTGRIIAYDITLHSDFNIQQAPLVDLVVPEPIAVGLMGFGLAGLGLLRRSNARCRAISSTGHDG